MRQVDSLQTVDGEFIRRDSITAGIESALFRNDQCEEFAIFEIQLIAKGHVFTLEQFRCDKKRALKDYKKILKELKDVKKMR
ncbi:MAG: hypothetical protein AAB514_00860 [Patescibacteria group bacterium]